MLFALPDHDTLLAALRADQGRFAGQAFVAHLPDGVYCRFDAPCRTAADGAALRFHDSQATCLASGFRPCSHCQPLHHAAKGDPVLVSLLNSPDIHPRDAPADLGKRVRRSLGVSLQDLRAALAPRPHQQEPPFAQNTFTDEGGFAAYLAGMGLHLSKDAPLLRVSWIDTPLGAMIVVADDTALHLLEFADRRALQRELSTLAKLVKSRISLGRTDITAQVEHALDGYFEGAPLARDIPVALHGTPFTKEVWRALQHIPHGETWSYLQLATHLGNPAATRAVARANGANQIAILIPCHRVIGADGSLTGYGGGLWRKKHLLEVERGKGA